MTYQKRITLLNANQIWSSIFTFISNSNSKCGSFSANKKPIKIADLFRSNEYALLVGKIEKIFNQSFEIIELVPDKIGEVNIRRIDKELELFEKLTISKIVIIEGEPGVGKSVIAKTLLTEYKHINNSNILTFKADQLINKNLRDLLLPFNIDVSLKDVFASFPSQLNIIYVDSCEKLLEGIGTGFTELIKLTDENANFKLVLSCRSINLNLFKRKFLYGKILQIVEIGLLGNEELDILSNAYPSINMLRKNERISSLIRNPKYLDFAIKAIHTSAQNFDTVDENLFMQCLWEVIIENRINSNINGLPLRRNDAFIDIAVTRAKAMSY